MSVAGPSRLAKDSSVLDNLRNPALQQQNLAADLLAATKDLQHPSFRLQEDSGEADALTAFEEGTPSQKHAHHSDTCRPQVATPKAGDEASEAQRGNEKPYFSPQLQQQQQRVGEEAKDVTTWKDNQGRGPAANGPLLESFASALDYVLEHLGEEDLSATSNRSYRSKFAAH